MDNQSREDKVVQAIDGLKSKVKYVVIGGAALIVGLNSFWTADSGYSYFVQDSLFGTESGVSDVGIHGKVPFFTKVYPYKQVATISLDSTPDGGKFTRTLEDTPVTFADTYGGDIPATFRFRLPRGEQEIIALHKEFRSFENLVDALLVKNAKNVTVVTATQYTGEEFYQGGLNEFKVQLEDQLANGLYQTERRQVVVETTGLAPVSSEQQNGNKLEQQQQRVWKNIVLTDDKGQAKRLDNPLAQYGIVLSQVTVDKPNPGKRLNDLLNTKRALVAKRINAIQTIETAKAEAKAETQRQEIEKAKQIQIKLREKELAVIDNQKLVAVEQQIALRELVIQNRKKDVAVVEREKVLAVSKANLGIQDANAQAAKFEAQAILVKGLAEAQVDKAKLQAKQSARDIYMAELQKDVSIAMYRALPGFQIEMPDSVVMGGGSQSALPNSMDILATLGMLDKMGAKTVSSPVTAPATLPRKQ